MAAVNSAARRAFGASVGEGGRGLAGLIIRQTLQGLLIAGISGVLFWFVWIYGNALRDPRFFDGWMLAGGMSLQLYFHVAIKNGSLSPKSATRWRRIHIFVGYLLAAAFLSHTEFTLPDSAFEWAIWTSFVFITLSGILGTYLAWSVKTKRKIDERLSYDRIPTRRLELARELQAAVARSDPSADAIALPALPYDAWIADLYTNQLRDFFQGQRNSGAHLIGSQRPVKKLTDEIDGLSLYIDQQGQEKLAVIRSLVIEKDRLDFAHVYLSLTRTWLLIHVPFTYGLVVLIVLHVLAAYAFSSGAW